MFASPRSELLELLAAIKCEPEENTPKLALADWLQEQPDEADQARGDFLYQFVNNNLLAKTDPARQDFGALIRLWDRHGAAWTGPLHAAGFKVWATNHMFRWGLLFPALDGSSGVVRSANALAGTEEYAWVAGVAFRALDPGSAVAFAGSPLLDSLIALRVAPAEASRELLGLLAESPRVAGLQSLDIGGGVVPIGALVRSPHLAGLRALAVRQSGLGDAGFRSLCNAPHLNALRALDASGNGLMAPAGHAFAEGTGLPALTELNLGPASYANNQLGPNGMIALVAGLRTGRLRKLNVSNNGITDTGAEALGAQPHLCNLTHLDLSSNLLTNRTAVAIARAEHLKTLEELNLRGNAITADGALALAGSPHLTNLRRLELSANQRLGARATKSLRDRFGAAVVL